MTEIKFVPKVCTQRPAQDEKGKAIVGKDKKPMMLQPSFEGHILLRAPEFDERYQMLEDMGFQAEGSGEVKSVEKNLFAMLRKMVKASRPFYVSVHLKKVSTGEEYKTFEDLSTDPECDEIILEVAKAFKEGFRPGKN